MLRFLNIKPVVADHFRSFEFSGKRTISQSHLVGFVYAPLAIGIGLSFWKPFGAHSQQVSFMTVYALVAAVMVGLLPVVQSVIGFAPVDPDVKFGEKDRPLWREQIIRLQSLRELYAEISFAVLLMVSALGPLLLAGASLSRFVAQPLSAVIYAAGASVAVSCLHIVTTVYLVLDNQAREASRLLRNNGPERQPDSGEATQPHDGVAA